MAKNNVHVVISPEATQVSWARKTFWILVLVVSLLGSAWSWPVSGHSRMLMAAGLHSYARVASVITTGSLGRLQDAQDQTVADKPVEACVSQGDAGSKRSWLAASGVPAMVAPTVSITVQPYPACVVPGLSVQSHSVAVMVRPQPAIKAVRLNVLAAQGGVASANQQLETRPVSTPAKPIGPAPVTALETRTKCNRGTTLNIVAHEDDDLLFLNPDVQDDVTAGRCMRTVFLTAGDAGQDAAYYSNRENGSRAAYAAMYNMPNNWHDEQQLVDGRSVTVSYLEDTPQIALVFLRLPDGNMHGQGFDATSNESLNKLMLGEIPEVHRVDDKVGYSKDDIVAALANLMQTDSPDQIRTQNPQGMSEGDHADHAATGELTGLANMKYLQPHAIAQYVGYPDRLMDANLSDEQIKAKQLVFLTYAKHDGAVCQSSEECARTLTYGNFLTRQYRIPTAAGGL